MRLPILSLLVLITVFILAACNLGASEQPDATETPPGATPLPVDPPSVTITAPQSGAEFIQREPVFVDVTVSDSIGVTQVQLLADGSPVLTRGVDEAANQSAELKLDWTPRVAGDVTLTVLAYRGSVVSAPATVDIIIRDSAADVIATSPPGDDAPIIDPNDPNCRVFVSTRLNFRTEPFVPQPDAGANLIRTLSTGEVLPVVGRLADNTWWQVRDVTETGRTGWVARGPQGAEYITLYDGTQTFCSSVTVVPFTPPATPTPQPTQTPLPTATPAPTATPPPTATLQPTAVPAPNLTFDGIFAESEVSIPQGETEVDVPINVNIRNTGGSLAQQFSVTARVVNGPIIDVGTFSGLNQNGLLSAEVTVTLSAVGEATIIFKVDSDEVIDESDEGDNEDFIVINVLQAP